MPFDHDRYVEEVLEPARLPGGALPDDPRVRYRVDETMSAAEVTETVRRVRQSWRLARGQLKFKRLVNRLEADDQGRYREIFSAAGRGDLGPLHTALAETAGHAARRRADAGERLRAAAGRLRLVLPDVVERIAEDTGLGTEETLLLCAELEIEPREPGRLPEAVPYAGYGEVRAALDTLGERHLARFVFSDACREMRVLGGFAMPDGRPLDQDALEGVRARWATEPRGALTTRAETVLTALAAATDPAELARHDLVARVRERAREHADDATLVRHAVSHLGLALDEARGLVFAVRHESRYGGPPGDTAARLKELIDGGDVVGAVALARTLGGAALSGEVGDLVAEAQTRLDTAVRLRNEAVREGTDPDRAWLMLQDALRSVPDLPEAGQLQARLAPHPAGPVTAEVREKDVLVGWEPSASKVGEIGYEVRRNGVPLAVVAGSPFLDEKPAVNVVLRYEVVARRGEGAAVPSRAGPLVLRPEPADVRVTAGDGVVSGGWTPPPEASRVVVSRDGTPVEATPTGFLDAGVVNGVEHTYVVAAVYPAPEGEAVTPGVRRAVTPRGRPETVRAFDLDPDPAEPGAFLVRCAPPATGALEIVALPGEPPWPVGTTVPVADVRAAGRTVPSSPHRDGLTVRPEGVSAVLLAVTVSGDLATVGGHREHVNLPPVTGLTAERRGEEVHVGFVWPPEVSEAVVRWNGRERILSSALYHGRGGVRLTVPETEDLTVEVAPALFLGGGHVFGQASAVRLPARTPVRYDLARQGPPWRRHLLLTLTCARPVRLARLSLVLRRGRLQPMSAGDGVVLAEWNDLAVPATLEIPAPGVAGPYWLRCFADPEAELVDPPVRRLRVG
ncbi:hypothetical protein [Streptosporangium saharense]|uniref:Fibronectin type-III domain-containing protein n=1 Tax=Streptosporangium saharense TaxID=1706840 RepID=A0A7W7VMP8_9ACTN|nr:hypothetical protein [Streptosporangium saharense]MBB4915972.1 hypothetical protein [Streptosporangium saharense]